MGFREETERMVRQGIGDKEISPPYMSMLSMGVTHLHYAHISLMDADRALETVAPEFMTKLREAMRDVEAAHDALVLYLTCLSKIGQERARQEMMEKES